MKLFTFSTSKNIPTHHIVHKAFQSRNSTVKHAAHRYERRKVREYLRHGLDSEVESSRFDRLT